MQQNKFIHEDIWDVCNSAVKKLVACGLVAAVGGSSVVNRNVLVSAQSIDAPNSNKGNGNNQIPNNGNEVPDNNNQQQRPRLILNLTQEEQEHLRSLQNGQHQDVRNNGNGSNQIPNNREPNNNQQQRPRLTLRLTQEEIQEHLRSLQNVQRQNFGLQFDLSLVQAHMNMPDAPIRNNFMMQEEVQNNSVAAPTMATHENHAAEMESESGGSDSTLEHEEAASESMELTIDNAENNNIPVEQNNNSSEWDDDYLNSSDEEYFREVERNENLPVLDVPLPNNGEIISVVNAHIVVVGTEHGPVLIMSDGSLEFHGERDILLTGGRATLRSGIPVHLNGLTMTMQEFPKQILKELRQARQAERVWPYANAEDASYFGLDKDFIEKVTNVESNLYGWVDTGKYLVMTLDTDDTMVNETHGTDKILFVNYDGRINIGGGSVQIDVRDPDERYRNVISNNIDAIVQASANIRVGANKGRSVVLRKKARLAPLRPYSHDPDCRELLTVGDTITDTLFNCCEDLERAQLYDWTEMTRLQLMHQRQPELQRAQQPLDHGNGVLTIGPEVPIVHSLSSHVNQIEGTGTTKFDQGDIVVGGVTDEQMERDVVVNVANKVSAREGITMELVDNTQFKMGSSLTETMDNVLDAMAAQTNEASTGIPKTTLDEISAQAPMEEVENNFSLENENVNNEIADDLLQRKSEEGKKTKSIIRKTGSFVFHRVLNYNNPRIRRMMVYAANELGLSGQAIIDFVERFFIQGG